MEWCSYRRWRRIMWTARATTILALVLWLLSFRGNWYPNGSGLLSPRPWHLRVEHGSLVIGYFDFRGEIEGLVRSGADFLEGPLWLPRAGYLHNADQIDIWVAFPLWVFALPPLAISEWARRRARRALPRSVCPACLYSLTGLGAGAGCPECGAELQSRADVRDGTRP